MPIDSNRDDGDGDDVDDALGDEDGDAGANDAELDALLAQVAATPEVHTVGDEDLLVGRTLGRFVVTARVGKGGMGVVYRARDPSLRRDVALKVLPDASSRDPARRARFLREARAAAGLTHPGIAAIHEVGFDEEAQVAYIAMELIDGHDLRHELAKGPLPVAEAERLALQIARALSKAHAAGIVHRDLKPENVMLTNERDAKILDFGLAKQLTTSLDTVDAPERSSDGASTREGTIVGTPGYMAPEQVLGRNVDARTDVFSFGVLLQEMLTGKAPFVGDTSMATALAVTRDPPAPLQRDDVPEALRAVVLRCLEKEPAARFNDGRAIVEVLASSLGAPAVSGPVPRAPVLTQETPSLTLTAHEAQTALAHAHVAPRRARVPMVLAALAVVLVLVATAAFVRSLAAPASPEDALRAVLVDPNAKIACAPFSVSGDIHSPQLGAAAANTTCQALMAWLWTADRVHGPASMLELPTHGAASFPEDAFFTDDGARALESAAARYAAVVRGAVHVDKDGTRVTLRVSTRDAPAQPLVLDAVSHAQFTQAITQSARALFARTKVPPRPFTEEERQVFQSRDGGDQLALMDLLDTLQADQAAGCAGLAARFPLFAAQAAASCGHPERGEDGLPSWPAGLAPVIDGLAEPARTYWRVSFATAPDAQKSHAALLREARKARSGILASELAYQEGLAWRGAGDLDAARTALDVSIALWPGNATAWGERFSFESDPELALRAVTAWHPQAPLWSHRAFFTKDPKKALPMDELNYFLAGRAAERSIGIGIKLFELGMPERIRALASFHLDRRQGNDARIGAVLLAFHEWGTGRLGAASDRLHAALEEADRLDYAAQAAVAQLLPLDSLLERPGLEDRIIERFLLAEPARVEATTDASYLADLFVGASPDVAKKGLAAVRKLVESGALARGRYTDLALDGHALMLAGDVKGAAALWRIHAGDYGPPIHVSAFERAGELDLAEKRYRLFVAKFSTIPRMQHVRLARLLAKRGALEEAKPVAQAFVTAYERTDVEVPAVKEMKALLARVK